MASKPIPLEEDVYIEGLERIIEANYFPELAEKRKGQPLKQTNPETGETIVVNTDVSLSTFQSLYTSEDNASFAELMRKSREYLQQKFAWLFSKETPALEGSKNPATLLLTDGTTQGEDRGNETKADPRAIPETWAYKVKNTLMYIPEGAPKTQQEILEETGPPKKVVYENTRFQEQPYGVASMSAPSPAPMATEVRWNMIGASTPFLLGTPSMPRLESPRVQGYGFVSTPSPAPGVDCSPFVTWGTIEGPPLVLEEAGPQFKVPEPPARERLAHSLVEKRTSASRTPKARTLVSPYRLRSPASSKRVSDLDLQLRASYKSPSTPLKSPRRTPQRTPEPKSLTDGLLE
jgi:protein DGCR14